ncbi:MAG: Acyl carrier protein [Syntrophorhabdaceae bacterium PtaU1.Bin034]|nr:MAG: Acyl carrier protein [Syntrophorhabdaceae bacterium PtaU1.Bin034]
MTTTEKVCELILELKKKNISPADLKPEALLVDDLNLDSLDFTELMVLAEDAFAIQIPLEDTESLKTIGDAVEYFDKRLAG